MTGINGIPNGSHDNNKMAAKEGVARSRSFTTRTSIPDQGGGVLGERYRQSPSDARKSTVISPTRSLSLRGTPKLPKVPRPSRAQLMFTSVKRGLRECVYATEEDIGKLQTCVDLAASSSTGQQIKAAERYKKRLEFQLAKVEELEEDYMLQQQLREGVKTMAKAYVSSTGDHKKESLEHVKYGYKECTQTMCAIEAQLETMLGTFHCQMKGINGFARLAPGDVFEVSVRYGHQKWKSKGRVGVSQQTWDNEYVVFKSLVGEVLAIKAVEVRGLGRTVLLGQKNCETKDLFSSHPQMMTVNINTNGSLKLSLVITWSPLEAVEENICFYEPPPKSQGATRRTYSGSPTQDPLHVDQNGVQHRGSLPTRVNKENRLSVPVDHPSGNPSKPAARPNSVAIMNTGLDSLNDSMDMQQQRPRLFDMRLMAETVHEAGGLREDTSLEEAIQAVNSVLEDFRGHYPELQKLEEQILELERMVRRNQGAGSTRSSDVSISIENALGAFDFLEAEEFEGYSNASRQASLEQLEANSTLSPESTAKTNDSGIESLGRLQEEHAMDECERSSPDLPSTGNAQVDHALLWHLGYCERLLENLGNFGPLKCREIYSVDKLQKQADIVEDLIQIAKAGATVNNLHAILVGLTSKKDVRHFWTRCVDQLVLYTNAERFMAQLERHYGDKIRERYDISATKVFRILMARILDIGTFDPESASQSHIPVTMHAVVSFFDDEDRKSIVDYVLQLAGELWVTNRLRSGDTDLIIKTTLSFREKLPPAECMRISAMLLITEDKEVKDTISYYLRGLGGDPRLRDKAIITFVEALEDRSADVRCAACMALKLLNAVESMDQLVYVCQSDTSHMVRVKAKEALLSFGDEGRKAFRDSELSSHGFQGLQINL